MANRTWSNFGHFYAPHSFPILVDCNIAIGATGAVGTTVGTTISSVTRLAAGIYKVKLQDNYFKFFGLGACSLRAPVTGSDVPAGSLSPGTVYEITALGTTTTAQWVTAGVPVGITPAVGVAFLAAATSAGTGTAKAIGASGISSVEVVGNTNLQLGPVGGGSIMGGYVIVQCMGPTDASTTTMIAKDPANGSVLFLSMYLSNSSVVVSGE